MSTSGRVVEYFITPCSDLIKAMSFLQSLANRCMQKSKIISLLNFLVTLFCLSSTVCYAKSPPVRATWYYFNAIIPSILTTAVWWSSPMKFPRMIHPSVQPARQVFNEFARDFFFKCRRCNDFTRRNFPWRRVA